MKILITCLIFAYILNINAIIKLKQSKCPKGVYIHIPFCRRRCFYCDFPIKVIGERQSTRINESKTYTKYLIREIIASTVNINISNNKDDFCLETIYFGGGTPSLLTNECIHDIIITLQSIFSFKDNIEITLEMDPGTFDFKRLQQLKQIGINRISMGVQSFDESMLKSCGRAHSLSDIYNALDALNKSDFDNFSIDLISSLPGMSMTEWENTLKTAISTPCTHISVYDLQIEDNTAFGRWYSPGNFPLPNEELSAEMYKRAVDILVTSGFEHYEVSNYAKPNKRSIHNQKYWNCDPYWGFGLGSASFLSGLRYTRPKTMKGYIDWIEQLEKGGIAKLIINHMNNDESLLEIINNEISDNEFIVNAVREIDILDKVMLSLRTADGLNLKEIGNTYGEVKVNKVINSLKPFAEIGKVEFYDNRVRLTDPHGFITSNDIISSVFAEFS